MRELSFALNIYDLPELGLRILERIYTFLKEIDSDLLPRDRGAYTEVKRVEKYFSTRLQALLSKWKSDFQKRLKQLKFESFLFNLDLDHLQAGLLQWEFDLSNNPKN